MNLADSTPTFHCKGFSRLKSLERLISREHRYIDPMKFHFYFGFAADLWHTEAGNRVFRIPTRCFELEHSAHRILVSYEHLFLTIVEFEWVLSRIPLMEN